METTIYSIIPLGFQAATFFSSKKETTQFVTLNM
jgi:hypothetical protein